MTKRADQSQELDSQEADHRVSGATTDEPSLTTVHTPGAANGWGRPDSPGGTAITSIAVNADTFESFFCEHHDTLVRALTMALGDAELGRDAASEGFARALQRWSRVERYDNAAGWVYRVGLNWARSRRRKTIREISREAGRELGSRTTDRAAAIREPNLELATALRSLSVDHRAVIVGRYYLDWSEAELAAALDIAPGTVKSRLSRALDQLQLDLDPSANGEASDAAVGS